FPIADTLIWDVNNATGISVEDGYLNAYDRGVYSIVASIDGSSTTIHIVVKSPTETEYVVFEEDYRSETADVSDWKTTIITNDSTEYTGKTYSGNYINNNNFQYSWSSVNDHPKGFVPYNAEELENAVGNTDTAVYTTLNNDVVAALSDYTVTAGIKAYPNFRGAVGVIGRVNGTVDGKYTVGTSIGSGFALSAGGGEGNYIQGNYPNGAFSISGNTRTLVTSADVKDYLYNTVYPRAFIHRTFEISYSGDTATIITPNGGTEVLSGINTQTGTVGLVSYFKDGDANFPYASVPVLSDIKIVLNNVDLSGLPSEDIPNHTAGGLAPKTSPYVDNGNYTFTVDNNGMITAYNIVDSSIGYSEKVTIPGEYDSMAAKVFSVNPKNTTLGEVVIGEGFRFIWDQAFMNNYFLDTVSFPTSLVTVGANAFQNSGVTDISFPTGSKLTTISDFAFANCYSLRSLELPEGLEAIGTNAFQNAISLTSVKIPTSVTSIGDNAFAGCTILKEVYIYNAYATIGNGAIPAGTTIYGNVGSTAETYANANNCIFIPFNDISANSIAANSAFNLNTFSCKIGGASVMGTDISWDAHRGADYEISNGWLLVYGEEDFTISGTYNGEEVSIDITVAPKGTDTGLLVNTIADEYMTIVPVNGDDTAYTVTVSESTNVALKYGTLTVTANGSDAEKITVATDNTGKVFGFNVVKPETMVLSAEYTTLANRESSIYPLGIQIRPETNTYTAGLRFVTRFPEIKKTATGIYLDEAYTQVGVLVIPEVLWDGETYPTADSLAIATDDEDGVTEVSVGKYSAQNVLVKKLMTATEAYSDASALLTEIPEEMKSVSIVAIPYLIGADGSVTYVDGELSAKSYNDIFLLSSYPEYNGDVDVLFYGGTDHDIDGIDSTSAISYKTGEDISFILNLKTAYTLSWQLDKDDPAENLYGDERVIYGTKVLTGTFNPATDGSIFTLTTQMANAGVASLTVDFIDTEGATVATIYISAAADYENITQSLEEGFTADELVAETSGYYNSWTAEWDTHIADVNAAIDNNAGLSTWLATPKAVGAEYTINSVLKLQVAAVGSNYTSYYFWIATDNSVGIATNGDSYLTRPATGVFAVPNGVSANSLNMRVGFLAYNETTVGTGGPTTGTVTVRITSHGLENGSEFDGDVSTNMIGDNPETAYQYGILRRDYTAMQVAKHLFADILADDLQITTNGGSMAGWQSVVIAAFDEDVNKVETSVTWMCQLGANQYGDIISWHPDAYVATTSKAARVFSTVTAARIVNNRVVAGNKAFTLDIMDAGLGDYNASAPHGIIALYNAFDGNNANITKSATFYQFRNHGDKVYGAFTKFVSSLSNY
ncbi:MAG: leucine-rich repeat domain-containing protein, partial [Ruminococcaceae bacterium]|nr:leucine-rich repeat domain-containing protein [Oscillospiraceae bacterium]